MQATGAMITEPDKTLLEMKHSIEQGLRDFDQRIIALMDDIDRLPVDEIRQMVRLVAAVADFPNLTYVLTMDDHVVTQALRQASDGPSVDDGSSFLSKIVQIPFRLPTARPDDQSAVLWQGLQTIMPDLEQPRWGGILRWIRVQGDGTLAELFSTLRDVYRYLNVLDFEYGIVRGEVNPLDMAALTAIKVRYPFSYQAIASARSKLVNNDTDGDLVDLRAKALEPISDTDRQKLLDGMLCALFPRWPGENSQPQSRATPVGPLDIANANAIDRYFILDIPSGQVSYTSVHSLVALSPPDPQSLRDALARSKETGTLVAMLRALEEEITVLSESSPPTWILGPLLDVSDTLVVTPNAFSDPIIYLLRIVYRVLGKNSDRHGRLSDLACAINQTKSVYACALVVAVIGEQHGKFGVQQALPEPERSLDSEDLRALETLMAEKLSREAHHLDVAYWPMCLPWWSDWNKEGAEEFVRCYITGANRTVFIQDFMDPYVKNDELLHPISNQWSIGMNTLVKVIGPETAKQWVEEFQCSGPSADSSDLIARMYDSLEKQLAEGGTGRRPSQ